MRALIVEDNLDFADLLYEYLNYYLIPRLDIIGTANDGFEALRMIKEKEPDIVFLDLVMPNLDGISVLKELNALELNKRPYIFAFTAVGSESIKRQAMQLGVDQYLIKPFDLTIVGDIINEYFQIR